MNKKVDLQEHFEVCKRLVDKYSTLELLEGLYTTFKVNQGPQTANLRKAILLKLEHSKPGDAAREIYEEIERFKERARGLM